MEEPKDNVTIRIEESAKETEAPKPEIEKETSVVFVPDCAAQTASYFQGWHDAASFCMTLGAIVVMTTVFIMAKRYAAE